MTISAQHLLSVISLFGFTLVSISASADIRLPRLLADNLVLQRDTTNPLWGWADDGETVTIVLDGKTVARTVAKQGRWQTDLPPQPAGGPHDLTFAGNNTVKVSGLLFGDVWVASGQSNMQLPMERVSEMFSAEIANANYPRIRQFTVPREMAFDKPRDDFSNGEWQPTTPETVLQHSAVAHFFARDLYEQYQVPIGILSANFGGSPAECWMSEDALKQYPDEYKQAVSYQKPGYLDGLKAEDKKAGDQWYGNLDATDKGLLAKPKWSSPEAATDDWKTMTLPGAWKDRGLAPMSGVVWFRKTLDLPESAAGKPGYLRLGTIVDADIAYINGEQVGRTYYQYPPRRYQVKENLLKAGANTLVLRIQVNNNGGEFVVEKPYYLEVDGKRYDLTGDWQYQVGTVVDPLEPPKFVPYAQPLGCYNAMLAPLLQQKIKGVIWYQGESNSGRPAQYATMFPHLIRHWRQAFNQGDFPFLFVQLPNFMAAEAEPSESNWAETRFAQTKALAEPNTAMAVAIDVGEWNDLHPLNKKAVADRLALAARALAYGEDIVYASPMPSDISVKKNKVTVTFKNVGSGLKAKDGKLAGFALADASGEFHWAKAKIKGNRVIVWHPDIKKPVKIRYAWAHNPDTANLYNKEGLPASPFEWDLDQD